MVLMSKTYSLDKRGFSFKKVRKDIKQNLKLISKDKKYIIHIWTDSAFEDFNIEDLCDLYYEELVNFCSNDDTLIERKLDDIFDEIEKIERLNWYGQFNFEFNITIKQK